MTAFEAKVILGLREDDEIDKKGLREYKEILEKRLATTMSRIERNKIRREMKAVEKLERLL